MGIKEHNLKN